MRLIGMICCLGLGALGCDPAAMKGGTTAPAPAPRQSYSAPVVLPPRPARINPRYLSWDNGVLTHDACFRNDSGQDLFDVNITLTFWNQNGQTVRVRQLWGSWMRGEIRRVNLPAQRYEKTEMDGNARMGAPGGQKGEIRTTWT